jgi:hypothetical protein
MAKYRISVAQQISSGRISFPVGVDNMEELILHLRKEGAHTFSLKYTSIIDDSPTVHENRLSVNAFSKDHFDWLVTEGYGSHKYLEVEPKQEDYNKLTDFHLAVYDGLRKTINRFREKPLYHFTEADIHSFLLRDLLEGSSKHFIIPKKNLSLVHLEYPTNFRYKKANLIDGYSSPRNDDNHITSIKSKEGDRGNFDITILNPDFIQRAEEYFSKDDEYIAHVINKKKDNAILRKDNSSYNCNINDKHPAKFFQRELEYAIEVKFIHQFNARNSQMLKEVVKDNQKLFLAAQHSNLYVRPINLVFCSSSAKKRKDGADPVIDRIRKYIKTGKTDKVKDVKPIHIQDKILNIFIESYFDDSGNKNTPKPIAFCREPYPWVYDLCRKLGLRSCFERPEDRLSF